MRNTTLSNAPRKYVVDFEDSAGIVVPEMRLESDSLEEIEAILEHMEDSDEWPEGHDAFINIDGYLNIYMGGGIWDEGK